VNALRLDAIVGYNVDHLLDGITYWDRSQANWTSHAEKTRFDIEGLNWTGHAGDAALTRAVQDERAASDAAAVVHAAQQSARQEIDALTALQSKVLSNVAAAGEDGFQVNNDLSVQDLLTEYDDDQTAQTRQQAAEQHCADIYSSAKALYQYDAQVAEIFRQHRTDLQALG
jgi:hypothetical protein